MEYIAVVIFSALSVLAIFWMVAKSIGKLSIVKKSPTLDDIQAIMNPESAEEQARAHEEYSRKAESLPEAAQALADAGDKIGAVKSYMDDTGTSLAEAKKTIEAYLSKKEREQ